MSDSLGGVTQYAYDPEDRLTKLTAPWGTEYDFGYDGFGRRTSLTSTSGRVSTMGYTNGLLSALKHAQNGVPLTDLAYRYDVDGQLIGIDDLLDPSKSKGIAYDDLNRLVQVAEGIPVADGGTQLPIEDYAYDEEGNRTASHLSVLYASNDHNQLTEDDDYTYAYDAKGNRISKTAKVGGAVETYSYDSQNRLVGYASPTTVASYAYDAMERRIAKTVDEVGTAYVYDMSTADPLAMDDITLEFEIGAIPTLKRRWAHSNAVDEPVGFEEYNASGPAGSGSERLMYADRQGSILWVTEPVSDAVVAAYEYKGFGELTQTQGTLIQPYGYTGRQYDPEIRLYYYRARFYDPIAGKFLNVDPIEFASKTLNLFSYADQSPFHFSDPSGLTTREFNKQIPSVLANNRSATTHGFVGAISLAGAINGLLVSYNFGIGTLDVIQNSKTGTCSAERHSALQAAVSATDGGHTCKIIPYKIANTPAGDAIRTWNLQQQRQHSRHAIARATINAACFAGGDPGHRKATGYAVAAVDWCTKAINVVNASRK